MVWHPPTDPGEHPLRAVREVRDELFEIAGHRNALDGRLVDVAVWLLTHSEWKGEGLHTPERFLAWRCGLTAQAARRYVRIAERADELPATVGALRRGELSVDQVMPIVADVPAWADEQVQSLAVRMSPTQIRRLASQYAFDDPDDVPVDDDPADVANAVDDGPATPVDAGHDDSTDRPGADGGNAASGARPQPRDRAWMGVGDDGRFRLSVECSPELGEIIRNAVAEVRDDHLRNTGTLLGDAEALGVVAQRSLDAVGDPARRDRFRTLIHLDTSGAATDQHGRVLPDVVARHITCDGLLTPVFVSDGVPVSVGRTQRIVPDRTRRLVVHRDGGCRVPGCHATHTLEVHHIVHWSDHGPTDTWNLVTLCPHHHRLHHLGRLGIRGDADDPDGITFTNEHGGSMGRDGPRPTPPERPPPQPVGTYRGPLGERFDSRWLHITRPDRRDSPRRSTSH